MVVPVCAIIEGNPLGWAGIELPSPAPINCMALDAEAADAMLKWYGGQAHYLHFGPNVEWHASMRPARGAADIR
jgi:hypothetical protein